MECLLALALLMALLGIIGWVTVYWRVAGLVAELDNLRCEVRRHHRTLSPSGTGRTTPPGTMDRLQPAVSNEAPEPSPATPAFESSAAMPFHRPDASASPVAPVAPVVAASAFGDVQEYAREVQADTPHPEAPFSGMSIGPQPPVPAHAAAVAPDAPVSPPGAGRARRRMTWSNLEEQLGTRWPVWLGGVALFLAAAFFVKYTFDSGLLTPPIRVLLGVLFGGALLAGGEFARWRGALIAQGLTAAGIAALFACFLAATNLYHLVDRTTGFATLAGTTALAVFLSLRQGPFVALLGLVAGFVTPALIGADEPQPASLFTYLIVLQVGLLAVGYQRRWWFLSGLTSVGGFAWALLWLATQYTPLHSAVLAPYLVATVAANVLAVALLPTRELAPHVQLILRGLGLFSAAAGLGVLVLVVDASGFATFDWVYLGLLAVGCIVLGRYDQRFEPLAWLATGAGLILLVAWKSQAREIDLERFGWIVTAYGGLCAAGAYAALFGAARPTRWASLAVGTVIVYVLAAYWAFDGVVPPIGWGRLDLVLAGALGVLAVPVHLRRSRQPLDGALTALLIGVTMCTTLAAAIELHHEWRAIAWVLQVPVIIWLAGRLRLPSLHPVAAALALLATVWQSGPHVLAFPIGAHPVLNWLPYGYGIPVLALVAGVWLLRQQSARPIERLLQVCTALLTTMLVTLSIRQAYHPAHLAAAAAASQEWSAHAVAAFALSGAAFVLARGAWQIVLTRATRIFAVAGMALAGPVLVGVYNPLWYPELLPAPAIVSLLYNYGVPTIAAGALAILIGRRSERPLVTALQAWTVGLLVVLVTLCLRSTFHPADPHWGPIAAGEWATYVIVWFGLALVANLVRPRSWARVLEQATAWLGVASSAVALCILALQENPLWTVPLWEPQQRFAGLVVQYGLPALLAGVLALLLSPRQPRTLRTLLQSVTAGLGALLLTLSVRHYFHPLDLRLGNGGSLREAATLVTAWLAAAIVADVLAHETWQNVLRRTRSTLGFAGLLGCVVGLLLVHNPVLTREALGTSPVVNWLLYVYGLPAALFAVLTWRHQVHARPWRAGVTFLAALGMLFVLTTFEVRQAFHGDFITLVERIFPAENYAYSAAWVGLGVALLVSGIATRGRVLRWASLAVMLLAIGKVFLYDTAHLRDLYRVFSLLGLGASLLTLGLLYQRFVFGGRSSKDAAVVVQASSATGGSASPT